MSLPEYGVLKDSDRNIVEVSRTFTGPPTLTYEPGAAWEGEGNDSFSFKVIDPEGLESNLATVATAITKAVADGG